MVTIEETLILKRPTIEYEQQIVEYKDAFKNSKDEIPGTTMLDEYETGTNWLTNLELYKQKKTLPNKEHVPSFQYLLIRKSDNQLIGMSNIRTELNGYLLKFGGHIGYSIAPNERRKEFGYFLLFSTLEEAKRIGIEKVLVTCDHDNLGSRKIIEANNGVLENIVCSYEQGKVRRYWIKLTN